jgi:hypothetical protein
MSKPQGFDLQDQIATSRYPPLADILHLAMTKKGLFNKLLGYGSTAGEMERLLSDIDGNGTGQHGRSSKRFDQIKHT